MAVDLTRLSEKGQVVIPNELRKSLGLKVGTRFLVMGMDDLIILRRIELSKERMRLKRMLGASRERAEKVGFSGKEIDKLIHSIRKVTE
jgi:AbrB family looped-hinge helix DNA binding protein